MSANARFIEVVEELKRVGKVRDYKNFADSIGVSKSFLSDLKAERKKVSVEALARMKNEYPDVDLTYIITGIRVSQTSPAEAPKQDATTQAIIDKMQLMAEEIGALKYQLKEARATIAQLEEEGGRPDNSPDDWSVKTAGDVDASISVPTARPTTSL